MCLTGSCAGGGDAQQPGAEQPAGEPVLEDLARRQEEEAGTPPWLLAESLRPSLHPFTHYSRLLCFSVDADDIFFSPIGTEPVFVCVPNKSKMIIAGRYQSAP